MLDSRRFQVAIRIEFGPGHCRGICGDLIVSQEALELSFPDFEHAVTAVAARTAGCAYIVTRDPKGFRESPVRTLMPEAVTLLL